MTDHAVLTDATVITLSVLKIFTVMLGVLIVTKSWQAYKATNRKPFLWLTIGFGLMTVGAIAEGAAYRLLFDLDQAHIIEAVFTLSAFAVLVYSLYARESRVAKAALGEGENGGRDVDAGDEAVTRTESVEWSPRDQ
jgi:hypothetical protein